MLAGSKKVERKLGNYELFGCDILITDEFKPYLLEINYNPALWVGKHIKIKNKKF